MRWLVPTFGNAGGPWSSRAPLFRLSLGRRHHRLLRWPGSLAGSNPLGGLTGSGLGGSFGAASLRWRLTSADRLPSFCALSWTSSFWGSSGAVVRVRVLLAGRGHSSNSSLGRGSSSSTAPPPSRSAGSSPRSPAPAESARSEKGVPIRACAQVHCGELLTLASGRFMAAVLGIVVPGPTTPPFCCGG